MENEDLSKLKIDKSRVVIRPRKRRRVISAIFAVICIVVLVSLYAKGVFTPSIQVQVATVSQFYPSQAFTLLNASGYVVAQRKSALASKVTGRLIWLGVEEGSPVKKGQVVARLENQDVSATRDQAAANVNVARFNLDQAQAELRDATLTFNRNKELLARGVVAKQAYDDAEARYDKAVAAVASAEAAVKANTAALEGATALLEYTLIRAPFDAVVLTKDADVGDIVTPLGAAANAKAAVVTIADMSSLEVEADVSESNLSQIRPGQPCEIQLDALPDRRFRGQIHMIVPTADRSKATVMVKVRFIDKDSRVLPEMSAKVAFLARSAKPEEQRPRTALQQAALVSRKDKKVAFVIKEDRVVETPVSLGIPMGDVVEVLGGVKVGDRVVLNPPDGLKNGSKIRIEEK
ncbi:MAG TPA: efflux RND transporter periplasmic adaptor subunit [Desulfatiglandales bacterium]|nr:efflux RND transporter periplasmic adaptor subunit [Desulfatiglandales bacterium]